MTVAEAVPVREVPDLDYSTYEPDGMTALYDAIGYTMRVTDDFVAANKPDQVLFVIMTDGAENSSREFTSDRIYQMIQDRQKLASYEFIYLGANQDSYVTSQQMGMRQGRSVDYAATHDGSLAAMKQASRNVHAYRRHGMRDARGLLQPRARGSRRHRSDAWKQMSAEEKKRHLDEGKGKSA